ncbi:MAG TPA: MBL fold metallo-hydrolase [Steroidobacteraceae bacterium]
MRIDFVNHASLIVSAGDVRLISDPWLEGKVFHDGWGLTARSAMAFDDFKDITHIWFSHEHPDHFNPDNLKKIPEAHRRAIHVLYQETKDKKVIKFCQKLGFKQVTELPPRTWIQLGEQMQILNCPNNTNWLADSWLCVRTPGGTLLNLNDCGAHTELEAIKKMVGDVDVLATQFSFAQWEKNRDATDHRRAHDRGVLKQVKNQIEALQPRWVIPFASFAWFCTEDNFYLNVEKNKLRDVVSFLRAKTKSEPVAMYPGDRWTVGEPHDSAAAITRFEEEEARIANPASAPLTRRDAVDAQALIAAGERYRRRLIALAPPPLVRLYLAWDSYRARASFGVGRLSNLVKLARADVECARLFVTDLDQAFVFDLGRGLQPADIPRDRCDITLSSASLAYCFQFDWGGETLYVNGCFQENESWRKVESLAYATRFFKYSNLLRRVDLGHQLSWRKAAKTMLRKLVPV